MAIKKAYKELWDFLTANKDKKVSAVLGDVETMCSAKSGGTGGAAQYIKNDKGVVTHVFCYYHKMWEPVNPDGKGDDKHVEYGKKANSATGLSSMCKEGTSHWTKQDRARKKATEELLMRVAKGEIKPQDIEKEQARIEKERAKIVPRKDGLGTKDKPA